jgi:hypothetical protein
MLLLNKFSAFPKAENQNKKRPESISNAFAYLIKILKIKVIY